MYSKLWWRIASMKFEVKVQDAWIGAYWKRDRYALHLWICFLPMLPLIHHTGSVEALVRRGLVKKEWRVTGSVMLGERNVEKREPFYCLIDQ